MQKMNDDGTLPTQAHTGDLLLTGAAGFVGSHLLLTWLLRHPQAQVLCPARGSDAPARVRQALGTAAHDAGAVADLDALWSRVTVVQADLLEPGGVLRATLAPWLAERQGGVDVIHCAANLSFRDADRQAVFAANVNGTSHLLNALRRTDRVRSFNYISTAYVAGVRQGVIHEHEQDQPPAFNNPYEESKWYAEHLVRRLTTELGLGMRIFRPSITIGHTATRRISSRSGLYKVVETLHLLHRARPDFKGPIRLASSPRASLNLIPVDLVVQEIMAVMAQGPATLGQAFHLTNERPLSIADIFFGIAPLTGIALECDPHATHGTRPGDAVSALVTRSLRHYLPYLVQDRTFDRQNMHRCGASRYQQAFWLDLVELRRFIQTFIAESTPETAAEEVFAEAVTAG